MRYFANRFHRGFRALESMSQKVFKIATESSEGERTKDDDGDESDDFAQCDGAVGVDFLSLFDRGFFSQVEFGVPKADEFIARGIDDILTDGDSFEIANSVITKALELIGVIDGLGKFFRGGVFES